MSANTVLMVLTNAYDPDPRVRQEALSLVRMGCRVRILAWDRDRKAPRHESMEGVDVERIFISSTHGRGAAQILRYAGVYLSMLWRGLRTPFHAVHCHDLDALPVGFVLGKLRSKPIVYDAHESFSDMLTGSVPALIQRVLVSLENLLMRRVDLVITVGEKLRRHMTERGAAHCVVVGNWKRLGEFSRTDRQNKEIRRQLGIPDDALAVVCITHLRRDRKIEELLAAAANRPDVYVIIAGDGVLAELVRKAAAANPRIIFAGFVSGRQIPDYTCAADAIYYGFDPENPNARFSAPNKLYEALAAGRPLITGNFGEIADVVRDAACGIVLPDYTPSEIEKAFTRLQDRGAWSTMAANAARIGRTSLNWEKGEEILYREYSRLLPGLLREPGSDTVAELTRAPAIGQ